MSPPPDRFYDDSTTFGEVWGWHQQDRPSCPAQGLEMAQSGFGCRICGWFTGEIPADPNPMPARLRLFHRHKEARADSAERPTGSSGGES